MSIETLGMDLGTTNSLAVVREGSGQYQVVANQDGKRKTPSVVMFTPDREVVGTTALNNSVGKLERVCKEVKRHMGEDWEFETPEGDRYTPAEISARILKKLRKGVEKKYDCKVKNAVISVPARFGPEETEATRTAGELAGFEDISLIEEPIAAVLSEYYYSKELAGKILAYDLGGGTYDVTVLEADPPDFDVLSKDGDKQLGGTDFTTKIVDHIEEKIKGFPDRDYRQEIVKKAESLKKDLSTQRESSLTATVSGTLKSFSLSRDQYESMILPLVERTIEISEKALSQADLAKEEVDKIILVGGSTRTPLVEEKVEEFFGQEPSTSAQPDEAVAIGTRFEGSTLKDETSYSYDGQRLLSPYVNQKLAQSIGVEAVDGDTEEIVNEIILNRDRGLPAEEEMMFSTQKDNQEAVKITLYEGESKHPENCTVIGKEDGYILEGIPPKKAGVPRIKVTLKATKEGIINLNAVEAESGKEIEVKCERSEIVEEGEKVKAKERLDKSQIN